jgi:hypothetical protein
MMKTLRTIGLATLRAMSIGIACLALVCCSHTGERDSLIDEPFSFEIKKNMIDDYRSIGTILSQSDEYPLWRENIADCAFCMIKTIEYTDLTIRAFSFDVAATGTAEYVVHGPSIRLRAGIAVGSPREDALRALGKPYKEEGNALVWKSRKGNFLVVSFDGNIVSGIRWHESREATYKNVRVWETRH